MKNNPMMSAPIPGENFTSDTRNYPWHRPPEHADHEEALKYMSKKLKSRQGVLSVISFLEMNMSVASIVELLVMKGMSQGKWTLDIGILMAGPLAHMIVMIARGYEVKFDLGIEDQDVYPMGSFQKLIGSSGPQRDIEAEVEGDLSAQEDTEGEGFMGGMMPSQSDSTAKEIGFMDSAPPEEGMEEEMPMDEEMPEEELPEEEMPEGEVPEEEMV